MTAKILAVDTATENCSVALILDGQVISRSEVAPREHTMKILPMVDEVLAEGGIRLPQLDALAFGRGPGSFTGVRIGIGIAQGLAFGADLPMIGVSTLAAMSQAGYRMNGAEHVAAAIDARMSEVYWGMYQRQADGDWSTFGDECVIVPAHLTEQTEPSEHTWLKVGTGWEAYQDELQALPLTTSESGILFPEAQDMAMLAQFAFVRGETVGAENASPIYLRDTVTWKKLPGRE